MMIITLGLTMIFEGIVATFFGNIPLLFPPLIPGDPVHFGSVILDRQDILCLVTALVVFAYFPSYCTEQKSVLRLEA